MTWRQQMKFLTFQKYWTLAILRLILLPNIAAEVHFRTSCYEGLLKLKLKGFSSSGMLELVSGHLGEGLLELLGDPLQLLLLAHQLVLQSVNLDREIFIYFFYFIFIFFQKKKSTHPPVGQPEQGNSYFRLDMCVSMQL